MPERKTRCPSDADSSKKKKKKRTERKEKENEFTCRRPVRNRHVRENGCFFFKYTYRRLNPEKSEENVV